MWPWRVPTELFCFHVFNATLLPGLLYPLASHYNELNCEKIERKKERVGRREGEENQTGRQVLSPECTCLCAVVALGHVHVRVWNKYPLRTRTLRTQRGSSPIN